MKLKIFLLMIIPLTVLLQAQKKAFTIKDLYDVKSVGAPVISNDGTKILFTVTEQFLKEGKTNTEIYVVNSDGTHLKKITNNKAADFNPVWSNNNKDIFFLSTRSGSVQLYSIPVDGGEAKQLTNYKLGISSPKFSQSENNIIFQASVFPECEADAECNSKIIEAINNGPIQAHIADSLFVRHWTEYNDGKYTHVLKYNFNTKEYSDLTPGYFHSPAFSAGGSDHYNFSPDGKSITFDSKRVKHPELSTNTDIFVVDVNGKNLQNITLQNKASDFNPKFSPDGKQIAYLTQKIPTYESDRIRLAVYDLQKKSSTIITESFDNWINDFEWSHDSKQIYFTAYEKGYMPLFKADVASKKIDSVLPHKTIYAFALSPKEDFVVYMNTTVNKPAELEYYNLKTKRNFALTNCNKELLDSVDIRPAEQVWIPGADGIPVHCFIVKPHNFNPLKKYPLIINVHGGPQYQWMDAFRGDWQIYPGAGYVVAFPNPHGSTGYGQEYTAAISNDWDGKVFEDIMKVTEYLAKLDYIDENRIGAMGWSYGGYFMNLIQAKTNRFKCLASMMGIYDLREFRDETEELWFPNWDLKRKDYEKMSPSKYENHFTTPTLIITGERDYRVPYSQSLRYFTVLQNRGIDSRLIIFKNDGHWPSRIRSMPLYYNAHLEWFHKYLNGGKAPWDSKKMIRNLAY